MRILISHTSSAPVNTPSPEQTAKATSSSWLAKSTNGTRRYLGQATKAAPRQIVHIDRSLLPSEICSPRTHTATAALTPTCPHTFTRQPNRRPHLPGPNVIRPGLNRAPCMQPFSLRRSSFQPPRVQARQFGKSVGRKSSSVRDLPSKSIRNGSCHEIALQLSPLQARLDLLQDKRSLQSLDILRWPQSGKVKALLPAQHRHPRRKRGAWARQTLEKKLQGYHRHIPFERDGFPW